MKQIVANCIAFHYHCYAVENKDVKKSHENKNIINIERKNLEELKKKIER